MSRPHLPVLPRQIVEALATDEEGWLLDGTLGAGGHSELLLEACPRVHLLGLDRDPAALALAGANLERFGERVHLVHAPFAEAAAAIEAAGAQPLRGALLDLGVSSMQLDQAERGFSFQNDGPLDMRMDPTRGESAAELLARLPQDELADLIYQLGEERHSRRIAREIVEVRQGTPLTTTRQLAELIEGLAPKGWRGMRGRKRAPRLHPATRTFQALRLAVNDELGQVERALPVLFEALAPGGRLAVISFHSLEDRIAKHFLRGLKQAKRCTVLTKKPLRADEEETAVNPRARSAKLRVGEKLA
jgi:16S rRNA (cytosine1402-N4)-methyltransferase